MTDYTSQSACLASVRSLTGYTDRDPILTQYLIDSAGTNAAGAVYYRPYFVASLSVYTDPASQKIASSKGTSFTNLKVSRPDGLPEIEFNYPALVQGWMSYQLRLDNSLGLTVPNGMAAVVNPGASVMSIMTGWS